MAVITVRNLDDEVQRRIKQRAAAHDQSMEAEVRAILSAVVFGGDFAAAWLETTRAYRGEELTIPPRSVARELDFS